MLPQYGLKKSLGRHWIFYQQSGCERMQAKSKPQFLAVPDIDWIKDFVDVGRTTWKGNVQNALKTISTVNRLPIKVIKDANKRLVTGYSLEAINLLKEKMEKHPENFKNGTMIKWE